MPASPTPSEPSGTGSSPSGWAIGRSKHTHASMSYIGERKQAERSMSYSSMTTPMPLMMSILWASEMKFVVLSRLGMGCHWMTLHVDDDKLEATSWYPDRRRQIPMHHPRSSQPITYWRQRVSRDTYSETTGTSLYSMDSRNKCTDECTSSPLNHPQPEPNPKLNIDFKLEWTEEDWIARHEFWESPTTAQWFKERGYTLFQRIYENGERTDTWRPTIPCDTQVESDYPYAHYDGSIIDPEKQISMRVYEPQGKVGFAHDSLNRQVAIKMVPPDSAQMKIFRFFQEQDLDTLKENCILPVLDILPGERFHFVVMPRWGRHVQFPWPQNVRGVVHYMHSMLKALNFLHKNNIAHLDICERNTLVNHFDDAVSPNKPGTMREDLRSKGSLLFAMYDFDVSFKFARNVDPYRFKSREAVCWNKFGLRTERVHGEPFVNPFVIDVGSLGGLFAEDFRHLIPTIPLLAPFLDKMTARPLSSRFRAEEALAFFENNFLTMSDAELDLPVEPFVWEKHRRIPLYDSNTRWASVTSDFAKKWAHCREPPVTWYAALLRKIVLTKVGAHIVYWVRWIFERPWGGQRHDMWFD